MGRHRKSPHSIHVFDPYDNFDWQLVSFEIVLGDHIDDNITDIGIDLAKSYFSLQHRVLFYNAYTNSHFGYCCVIWANWLYSNVHKIKEIQKRPCRLMLG